jgi:para-nitrobenzyl esterase
MSNPVVATALGALEGAIAGDPGVRVFRGIPYAEAPVGERRFRPPIPVGAWEGVRPATEFGPAAPQPTGGPLDGLVPGMTPSPIGEDCLSLTVWTPDPPGEGRPVLVWIHGGAFMIGSSSLATYDGARIASEHGVIVVSINYRLGALGFLDLSQRGGDRLGAVSNRGLLDQLLALEWIRDHIAVFGGDPGRITVFGESAGAGSILHLLGVPGIGGLMQRAIVQSPGVHMTLEPDQADFVTEAVLRRLDVASGHLQRLYTVPWEVLIEAQSAALMEVVGVVGAMPYHPVVDGIIVTEPPLAALEAGRAAGIDLLIGGTADEMRLFADPRSRNADRDKLIALAEAHLRSDAGGRLGISPARAGALVDAYLSRSGSSEQAWTAVLTDSMMRLPAMQVADAQSRWRPATYSYLFTWEAPGLGAFHAVDLPFTFGTFDVDGWGAFVGIDADGERLSAHMRAAWAAFAATGDPSTSGLGRWPRYTTDGRETMELGRQCRVVADPHGEIRRLWEPDRVPATGRMES